MILALESIKYSIEGQRYSVATEKLEYIIDMIKQEQSTEEADNG